MAPVYKLSTSRLSSRTSYSSMLAGNAAFLPTSFESIATVTVGSGGASNVEFTSIPNTYTHLQLRIFADTNRTSATVASFNMQFNSDTSANYSWHELYGNGTNIGVSTSSNASYCLLSRVGGSATNTFGSLVVDILDYANTNKYKTIKNLGGCDANGSGEVSFNSGSWRSTSAISSIKFTINYDATLITQYSSFALYGIKVA